MMAQTQPFGEVGYAKLGSFLTPAQLDLARHDLDGMICEGRDGTCERPNNTLTPLRWNDRLVSLIAGVTQERLPDVIEAPDLRWISGYISVPKNPVQTSAAASGN